MTTLTYNNKSRKHNDCGIAQNVLFPRIKKLSCLDVVLATVLSVDTNNFNVRSRATPVLPAIYSRQPIWDKPYCYCPSPTEARHALLSKMIQRSEYLWKKREGTSFHGSCRKQLVLTYSTPLMDFLIFIN